MFSEIKNVVASANKVEIRKFGITIGIFFLLVAAFLFWKEKSYAEYLLYFGAVIFILGITFTIVLKPLYILWMSFAMIMGYFMTRVILTLLFGLVFTPIGLAIRVIRSDPLKEKYDREAKSYWIIREKATDPKSVENQY